MARKLSETELEQRATAHSIHGGEGAIKRLADDLPLVGLAAKAEREVIADLETIGARGMVERGARRLEASAVLYWDAVCKAADMRDIDKLDRYVARFGWLQGKALGAWAQAEALKGKGDGDAADTNKLVEHYRNADAAHR